MRVPPSMMLQSWMGSDFTNDDLARESSLEKDYTPVAGRRAGARRRCRPGSSSCARSPRRRSCGPSSSCGSRRRSYAPLLYVYYDEPEPGQFEELRRLRFSRRLALVQGRPLPHSWEMTPLDKPGHSTKVGARGDQLRRDARRRASSRRRTCAAPRRCADAPVADRLAEPRPQPAPHRAHRRAPRCSRRCSCMLNLAVSAGSQKRWIANAVELYPGHFEVSPRGYRDNRTLDDALVLDARAARGARRARAGRAGWAPRLEAFGLISADRRARDRPRRAAARHRRRARARAVAAAALAEQRLGAPARGAREIALGDLAGAQPRRRRSATP